VVTDAGLVHVKGLTQMQMHDLSSTEVADAGLEHLKELKQLQTLKTGVKGRGLEHLKGLPNLAPNGIEAIWPSV
jgi:hypothetical protein